MLRQWTLETDVLATAPVRGGRREGCLVAGRRDSMGANTPAYALSAA